MSEKVMEKSLHVFFIVGTDRDAIKGFSTPLLKNSQYYNLSDPGKAIVRSNTLVAEKNISKGNDNLKSKLSSTERPLEVDPFLVDYLTLHTSEDKCLVLSDLAHTHVMHEWMEACRSLNINVRALYFHKFNEGNGKDNLSLLALFESATRDTNRSCIVSNDLVASGPKIKKLLSTQLKIKIPLIELCLNQINTLSENVDLAEDLKYITCLLIHNCNSGWSHQLELLEIYQSLEESLSFGGLDNLKFYSNLELHSTENEIHEVNHLKVDLDKTISQTVNLPLSQCEMVRILNFNLLNSNFSGHIETVTLITKSNKIIKALYNINGDNLKEGLTIFHTENPSIRISIGTYAYALKGIQITFKIYNTAKEFASLIRTYGQVDTYPAQTKKDLEFSNFQSPTLRYTVDNLVLFQDRYLIIKGWVYSSNDSAVIYISLKGKDEPIHLSYYRADVAALFNDSDLVLEEENKEFNAFYEIIDLTEKNIGSIDNLIVCAQDDSDMLSRKHSINHASNPASLSLDNQYAIQVLQWNENENPNKIDQKLHATPLISIVTPVYNVDPKWLDLCVQSVLNQTYPNWELCLYDDCSSDQSTLDCLSKWENMGDKRIKIGYGKENVNISGATNGAINLSSGDYITFLDNDDELTPDALFVVAQYLNAYPDTTLIYSDEDKLEMTGHRTGPYFKSDFNIDLLRSNNYFTHLTIIKRSLGESIGWLRLGYEGAQDHDFVLRAVDQTDKSTIKHIPEVLYHWRKIPTSTAGNYGAKDYAQQAGVRALQDHMDRNKIKGEIVKGIWGGAYRIVREIKEEKKVSILIPFKDQSHFLKPLIKSIAEMTLYSNFEILLIDNQSEEPKTQIVIEEIIKEFDYISHINYDYPFNYAAMNNWAVDQANGEYILLLNNDMQVKEEGWLTAMVEHIQRPEVGVVGCKLLYGDNTLQHAGVLMGINGSAGHAFKGMPDGTHYFNMGVIKNVSGVTGACLLTKKTLYQSLGGLDEERFKVAYNDVDYCLKVRESGSLIVYTPYSVLYHYESKSRGYEDTPEKEARHLAEKQALQNKWGDQCLIDPYYNPNFSYKSQANALAIELNEEEATIDLL